MGLLDNQTQQAYYSGDNFGGYQFVSLTDIINQFMAVYVGEDKIIPKARRVDVAFHAQRALAELSFDTFKSFKAQEILVPSNLQMILPHDYVNYTKLSWVDSAGIKHPLYKTNSTSNPFSIQQTAIGGYGFATGPDGVIDTNLLTNHDFASTAGVSSGQTGIGNWKIGTFWNPASDSVSVINGQLTFKHGSRGVEPINSAPFDANYYHAYQRVDVAGGGALQFSATATVSEATTAVKGLGHVRIGLTTKLPGASDTTTEFNAVVTFPGTSGFVLDDISIFNIGTSGQPSYVDFDSTTEETKTLTLNSINVPVNSSGNAYVYVVVISTVKNFNVQSPVATGNQNPITADINQSVNLVNNVTLNADILLSNLQENAESTAWGNYKSTAPSENQDDYIDGTYWPMNGSRYGLDPQYAQANGSFYIDDSSGKIHFSSNVSGKTVILDYISDSLGTDGEMQVHKFAEEAMYRWIAHAIMAGRVNIPEYQVQRFKKEKLAAVRTAKLRLSNIKLEEITQILRGKSKQIKH
jgi:hypothetical protein